MYKTLEWMRLLTTFQFHFRVLRVDFDYDKTFNPVVKSAAVHIIRSLALSWDWLIHQLDVKNTFLNGTLTETVYTVYWFIQPCSA
jgi:hypothetical protein